MEDRFLCDLNIGLTVDLSGLGIGLGKRTTRYALVIDDLKVTYVGVSDLDCAHVEGE